MHRSNWEAGSAPENDAKTHKTMAEILTHGYSSESSRMYRKGLGGMDTLDNACMGAKSIRKHPLGESTNRGSALGQEALEQPQTIQLTYMYSQEDLGVYMEKVTP